MRSNTLWGLIAVGASLSGAAHAISITQITPKGSVNEVQQVVVQTSVDAVRLGNSQVPAPVRVQCSPTQTGQGRWNNAREWVWQFNQTVTAGTRCTIEPDKAFKSPSGAAFTGLVSTQFEVAGPSIVQTWPSTYEPVDEAQTFVLQLNGAATPESLQQHVHCRAEGVGERIPVRLLDTSKTRAVLQALEISKQGHYVALECNRRLTAGSSMQLVYGAGVQMANGVANKNANTLDFTVREAFNAELQCQRERANAGCLPIRDVLLSFSAPVSEAQARQVQLVLDGKKIQPVLDKESKDSFTEVRFAAPFEPLGKYQVVFPENFQDDAGRPLVNASAFPMSVVMGDTPPLLKFAAAPFGVLERFAEGEDEPAILPVTVRKVEAMDAAAGGAGAQLRHLRLSSDADIIRWWDLVQRYDRGWMSRKDARRDLKSALPKPLDDDEHSIAPRTVSLLQGQQGVQAVQLPKAKEGDPRPFEVVGIPLKEPGFHVLEAESPRLGSALLDERLGAQRSMFVRTSALVTNLAVHLKLGREGSAVWVTSLDKGKPVAGAKVQVSDCRGAVHASGMTDAQGVLQLPALGTEIPRCNSHEASGQWFVSARHSDKGVEDLAFVWSDWQRGIEPWRFNLPMAWNQGPELVAHTVFDRNLVRAGETVSMKHFVRNQTLQGLALPKEWPVEQVITHVGSGQQYKQALQWRNTQNGGRNAASSFAVPAAAKLGLYTVELRWSERAEGGQRVLQSGEFRVEAFRLPVFQGSVHPVSQAALVQPTTVPVAVNLNFINGGAANGHQVQVSALLRERSVHFDRWAGYSFSAPRAQGEADHESEDEHSDGARLVADKLALTLDKQGQGQIELPALQKVKEPQSLVLEASFADPNGEIQTLRSTHSVWPAAVLAGIRTEGWMAVGRKMRMQAVAVDAQGNPQAGVPLKVQAVQHTTTTTRKRLVGGFYSYDNQRNSKKLGEVCSGKSDARGLLLCEVQVVEAGEVELIVSAEDAQGHTAQAADTVWVTGQGELWFGGQDHDRMDVLAEKTAYAPGETAKLQVRMPFREATALVSVEREGVLHTEVVQLQGKDPSIELPVQAGWGPNVYVSVLALRGRLYEVPWYSFFTWGYKAPRQWWNAFWHGGKEYVAPTAMVDLSKPSFRLGVAELQVQDRSNQLNVAVQADKSGYKIRETAKVTVRATLPDGKPAAHAEVALAAVDKALLELSPNRSWDLRAAMWQRRNWAVETATAQMEVVGRRHYGRKAAAPGGGGGQGAPTRELLDTLLLWQSAVQLDAQGQAVVEVPLNDALTSFSIVVIADDGVQRFGTGSVDIRTSQDLQVISGLPPVVREGDKFRAMVTVRNSTEQAMQVKLQPRAEGASLAAQTVEVPAQEAREVAWDVTVPNSLNQAVQAQWQWQLEAEDTKSGAKDNLTFSQRLLPAVPLGVQQATIQQIDGHWEQALSWPESAVPGKGGVRLSFSDKLADKEEGVPGLRDWWAAYPYACLEQTVGKAIGLGDEALWQRTMAQLPTYLDDDGLAMYFPPQDHRRAQGSDTLTAHLLAVHHSLQSVDKRMQLPAAEKTRMESGLIAFVEGRLERKFWSPRKDLDVRKLAAIAALARSGKARPAMLESISIAPQEWPTHALIDWLSILQQMPQVPDHAARQEEALQQLKTRLSYQGSQVSFSTEAQDNWWWLMQSVDVNVARLLLTTMNDPAWDAERTRLVTGLLARQKQGSWSTTTANTWAGLALRQFSQRYEREEVTGNTTALLGSATQTVHWNEAAAQESSAALPVGSAAPSQTGDRSLFLPWGERRMGQLSVQHRGTGKPWVGLQSIAAVPRTQPMNAGYVVKKTVTAVQGANSQSWKRGDVVRVRLQLQASADMTWVALSDPIPAGATILGSGLGRDSEIAQQGEGQHSEGVWPAFVERGQDSYRVYWDYLPKGDAVVEYTMRLNNAGDFALPPTRAQALYAPEMFGELPNARWQVAQP
ncbi:alpha-2-macroglobulin family protein [Comamonas sp. NoAH]|uniref:alpha-2-macroglobulin family protein n=1 Tax=Comamonas halotolerans TaxID=3041496 RepID=UPI0024E044C5|nr:MG2 domain-containing protein [Comamonas sp. NoAH]